MASDVRLIVSGTNYYFAYGAGVAWNGSSPATPWTGQTTTPFALANNSITGMAWSPTTARPVRSFGPALTGGGALAVVAQDYAPVEEVVPIQIVGTTPAARLKALKALRTALDTGLRRRAVVLAVEPNDISSGLSPVYYEVLAGDVQESPVSTFGSEQQRATTDARRLLRATLTLTRRPLGGLLQGTDSAETAIATITYTNAVNVNASAMTITKGDLVEEGQPLNVLLSMVNTATAARVYLASVAAVEYDSTGFSSTAVGGSYTSLGTATFTGTSLATLLTQYRVTPRLIVRFSAITAGLTALRCILKLGGSSRAYQTLDFWGVGSTATGRLVDCGDIAIPIVPGLGISGNPSLTVEVQATGSGNATVGWVEIVLYHEFCVIPALAITNTVGLGIAAYPANDARVMLPLEQPIGYQYAGTAVQQRVPILSTPPVARTGASLWAYTLTEDAWAGTHNSTHTFLITATQAALYRSLRAD